MTQILKKKSALRYYLLLLTILPATLIATARNATNASSANGKNFTIAVRFKEIGKAETFVLSLGPGKNITIKNDSAVLFPGTYPTGYKYKITQISGPRKSKFTQGAEGTVGQTNIEIICDAGIPDGFTILNGKLIAPIGTKVLLENNGKDTLTVIARQPETFFTFPKPYLQGSTFNVVIKSGPPGFAYGMVITGGELTTIFPGSFLTVYAEYAYDLASRDDKNKVQASAYESWDPAICLCTGDDEGRYIAFISSAKGIDGSSGKNRQLFWRDRKTGETKLISKSANGEEGNANSGAPVMDASGTKLAFESYADNLVSGDGNKVRDVFLWTGNAQGLGKIERINTGPNGIEANAESFGATISGSGNDIAFSSGASNLTAGVSGTSTINVYLRNTISNTNSLISMDPKTKKGVGGSNPSIDLQGNRIAFYSVSDKLVDNDKNNLWDIFVFDKQKPTLKRITMAANGGERSQGTESSSRVVTPSISGNGRYVAYASTSPNIVFNDNNGLQDVFIYDIDDHSTIRASIAPTGEEGNGDSPIGQGEKIAISNNGSIVAFTSNATNLGAPDGNVFMYNKRTNELKPLTTINKSFTGPPSFSINARYAIFVSGSALDGRFRSTGQFVAFTGQPKCDACY